MKNVALSVETWTLVILSGIPELCVNPKKSCKECKRDAMFYRKEKCIIGAMESLLVMEGGVALWKELGKFLVEKSFSSKGNQLEKLK